MSKLGPRNPIVIRLLIIIISISFGVAIIFFAITKSLDTNSLNYDIGERDMNKIYNDIIIKTYKEYEKIIEQFHIPTDLKIEDFSNNYYLVSFQEFDKCSETKKKKVSNVVVENNTIEVEFERYNRCGWCKSHMILYLIKIDKIENIQDIKINYKYNDDKLVNCGNALD